MLTDIANFHRCCYYLRKGWQLPVTDEEFKRLVRIWLEDKLLNDEVY